MSKLCKLMDEEIKEISQSEGGKKKAWTADGFADALRILTSGENMLFESLIGKVVAYPELNDILQNKIFNGQTVPYTATNPVIDFAAMVGIIKNADGVVVPNPHRFDCLLS